MVDPGTDRRLDKDYNWNHTGRGQTTTLVFSLNLEKLFSGKGLGFLLSSGQPGLLVHQRNYFLLGMRIMWESRSFLFSQFLNQIYSRDEKTGIKNIYIIYHCFHTTILPSYRSAGEFYRKTIKRGQQVGVFEERLTALLIGWMIL